MILRHGSWLCLAWLLSGLSLPAHAICLLGCKMKVAQVVGKDLRFGSMVVVSGGSLTLNPSTGVRSGTANVVTLASLVSSVGPAEFKVTCSGSGSTRYMVALLTTHTKVETSSTNMALTNFVTSPEISKWRYVANCSTYEKRIKVGATLTVSGSQSPGNYTSATDIELTATSWSLF
jgi:hypothetical protein